MSKTSRPRRGSLQFYPRKRAAKRLPRVNWSPIVSESSGVLGFITYKVGMATCLVKDTTPKSMSLNKQVAIPVTILEAPNMKVFSVRFYKEGVVAKEVVVANDKELKRKVKVPKTMKKIEGNVPKEYDDIRVIMFSIPKQSSVKKTPDLIEVGVQADNKLDFVTSLIGKEIALSDFLHESNSLFDVRGLTTGRGTQGPVKRFGITLKFHKTEKGLRTPGSLAPWHPARVTFRTPMAGQLGFFSRIHYNLLKVASGGIAQNDINPAQGFKRYGKIKSSYIILKGSVQGPPKRQILITPSFRPSKNTIKRKYELLEVLAK